MSIRIILDNPPEFYTNLDFVSGRVVLSLARSESVGNVVVKLEGESRTALAPPHDDPDHHHRSTLSGGPLINENHKLLYKVQQVFPDERAAASAGSSSLGLGLGPGARASFSDKCPGDIHLRHGDSGSGSGVGDVDPNKWYFRVDCLRDSGSEHCSVLDLDQCVFLLPFFFSCTTNPRPFLLFCSLFLLPVGD